MKEDKEYKIPKYSIGDKVKVKSLDWYNSWYITEYLNGKYAIVYNGTGCLFFREEMTVACGKICIIDKVKESITIGPTDYTEYFLICDGVELPQAFYECFFERKF